MGYVWLILIVIIIAVAVEYPAFFFGTVFVLVAGFVAVIAHERRQEEWAAEQRREERRREQEEQARKQRQRNINELNDLRDQYIQCGPKAEDCLSQASVALKLAREEFRDGAFAPFWDAIESATKALASYSNNLKTAHSIEQDFPKKNRKVGNAVGSLPVLRMPNPGRTAAELKDQVRAAQKDFQFATIYEQRKTNELLHYGFRTLADAIYHVGDEINDRLSDINVELQEQSDALRDIKSNQDDQSAMLDNIQNRRGPDDPDWRN